MSGSSPSLRGSWRLAFAALLLAAAALVLAVTKAAPLLSSSVYGALLVCYAVLAKRHVWRRARRR